MRTNIRGKKSLSFILFCKNDKWNMYDNSLEFRKWNIKFLYYIRNYILNSAIKEGRDKLLNNFKHHGNFVRLNYEIQFFIQRYSKPVKKLYFLRETFFVLQMPCLLNTVCSHKKKLGNFNEDIKDIIGYFNLMKPFYLLLNFLLRKRKLQKYLSVTWTRRKVDGFFLTLGCHHWPFSFDSGFPVSIKKIDQICFCTRFPFVNFTIQYKPTNNYNHFFLSLFSFLMKNNFTTSSS